MALTPAFLGAFAVIWVNHSIYASNGNVPNCVVPTPLDAILDGGYTLHMQILKFLLIAVAVYLAIDFLGFIAWAFSGQVPPDQFFLGAITRSVISFF